MRSALLLATLLAGASLAGCASPPPSLGPAIVTEDSTPLHPHVVIGVVDDGINPYHRAFRDESPEAWRHPATYIPGYPATARALFLTLNASFEEAMRADADAWNATEPEVVYWIPGTRIVAYRRSTPFEALDPQGFGTVAAGRAAGNGTSLAPDARLAIGAGPDPSSLEWASEQGWIDVLLVGWNTQAPGRVARAVGAPLSYFAADRPLVASAGNGVALPRVPGYVDAPPGGGVGVPAFADAVAGVPGAIAVGGHDNGKPTPWTGTVPHVVADARGVLAPSATHTDELVATTGTTASAAWVAGAVARLILDARLLLGDVVNVAVHARLAKGVGPAEGPLADGEFTLDEARAVLFRTADPTVSATQADGEEWGAGDPPSRITLPVAWRDLPPGAWRYAFVGYGAVTNATLDLALAVLRGETTLPERAVEDAWESEDGTVRSALNG